MGTSVCLPGTQGYQPKTAIQVLDRRCHPLEAHDVPRKPTMPVADGQPLRLNRGDHCGGRVDECAKLAAPKPMQGVFAAEECPAEQVPRWMEKTRSRLAWLAAAASSRW